MVAWGGGGAASPASGRAGKTPPVGPLSSLPHLILPGTRAGQSHGARRPLLPVPLSGESNGPGSARRGTRTALISMGIPKLVRFAKSAANSSIPYIWYYYALLFVRRRRAAFLRAVSN